MPETVIINISDTVPPSNYATIDQNGIEGNVNTKPQIEQKLSALKTEMMNVVETNFQGTIKPSDPAPTDDGAYEPEVSSEDNKDIDPTDWGTLYANAGNLRAKKGYDTTFYKKGSVWTKVERELVKGKDAYEDWLDQGNIGTRADFVASLGSFTKAQFDQEADQYKTFILETDDVSSINFTQNIAPGAGSSIYIKQITESNAITKVRIKVATAGVGDFTLKRAGVKSEFASNIPLVAGWNEFPIDLDVEPADLVGYNTATSTASLCFKDGTGGQYVTDDGSVLDGNLAIELYSVEGQVNTFEKIVNVNLDEIGAKIGTSDLNLLNTFSKPKLRNIDYGVVSAFNLPVEKDVLDNNKIAVTGSAITGNFPYNDYAYSFGFTVNFPNVYSGNEAIATLNVGSQTINIYAGGTPTIAFNINGTQVNALPSFDYGNKTVKIVVVSDAYFINVYVDGQRMGLLNKNKKATQFNFILNKQNGKSFEKIAFWNRDISVERITQWNLDQNPFNLKGIKDKLFPAKGYQISDHLLAGNPYFKIPAEQSIIKFKGKYYLYYTAARSTPDVFIESGIAVAVSNRADGGYSQYTNDVVIGGLRNKAGVTRAMGSWVGVVGDYVYVFAAMDYTASSAGGKIFKSSNGLDFNYVGDFIPGGTIPYLANISIYPEKKGNYYYGIVEGKVGGVWISYLVRSLNFESGWEMVQVLNSLEVTSGVMYGGPELLRSANEDRWMCFYHAAFEPASGPSITNVAPTSLFYAECFDTGAPINWVNKKKVLDINDELDFYNAYNCDQVATPQVYEENGKTYLSYVLAQNIRPGAPADEEQLFCQIRIAQFDGTKEELAGIVPFEIA
ncbi:hypothetical protein [Chryseobacterium defluvii]|uniref:Uncharacterized protein n=1 Tax=Chryseobacterium defluvii TaxID=160396 RepID=A0A495SLC7_9FLAO|nr:hypothetical protein [Chryseobacterium defluvii]RKT01109.1 hypothetical protein BCF58_0323 [Chryseobacterium defluvii]